MYSKKTTKKENFTMTKKKIFIVALAVCLLSTLALGTLAWFTDEDQVTNDFYVGDSNTDPDEVFGIDLWETANGVEYSKGTKEDNGIKYERILPGAIYDKNPYFTNTGIHGQYLRAIVTVTDADILKEAMTPKGADHSEWYNVEMFLPGTSDKWTLEYKYYTNNDTFVFVYYYNEVLAAGATTEQLFDAVAIPTELTKEQAAEIDNFSITILGQVIQSEHLADVTNAKEVFAKYWDPEGVVAGVNLSTDLPNAAVSYPVTGNLGTVNGDLITYDPANYTDPENPGVLIVDGAKATIKAGASLIVIPAEQMNTTSIISDTDFVVEDGGKIVTSNGGAAAFYLSDVTVNGEKITRANLADMLAKYFVGIDAGNIMFF